MWNDPQSRPGTRATLAERKIMFIRKLLRSDILVDIVTRYHTKERLASTCFRGADVRKAGNFSRWDCIEKVLEDASVLEELLDDLNEACLDRNLGTSSLNIECPEIVGWESTDNIDRYTPDDLEHFNLNRKGHGLRLKLDRTDIRAPKTHMLTLVYELKSEDGNFVALIHSIYPGVDVGDLVGNVTKREGRIFFDWGHPGEE
ncbi:MAG: hypothetical protein QG579_220 [Patescibacteria group bacterium]|jgi:hypothetical protein|nr:hypothetical protein [Patescibacteria group bacterium]